MYTMLAVAFRQACPLWRWAFLPPWCIMCNDISIQDMDRTMHHAPTILPPYRTVQGKIYRISSELFLLASNRIVGGFGSTPLADTARSGPCCTLYLYEQRCEEYCCCCCC
jgi:hypothetical protein